MTDPAQLILLVVIVFLTLLLLVLGVQVFFILRELRKTVDKANKVLDDTGIITESVSTPIANLSELATGIKAGSLLASFLRKRGKRKDDE